MSQSLKGARTRVFSPIKAQADEIKAQADEIKDQSDAIKLKQSLIKLIQFNQAHILVSEWSKPLRRSRVLTLPCTMLKKSMAD